VNEASILSGKRVYETNARKSLFSEWKQGMLGMAFVGALNVSRIHLVNKTKLNRAE
jgi:phosphatidylserine decarboxylase